MINGVRFTHRFFQLEKSSCHFFEKMTRKRAAPADKAKPTKKSKESKEEKEDLEPTLVVLQKPEDYKQHWSAIQKGMLENREFGEYYKKYYRIHDLKRYFPVINTLEVQALS
jgi:hypothetical protein